MPEFTIKTKYIDYSVEEEDLNEEFDNEEDAEKEIERIKDSLPQVMELTVECDKEDLDEIVCNEISERTGWLIVDFDYEIIKQEGDEKMKNKYCQIGWRLTSEQRKAIKKQGFYVYANRSWDEGNGCTLEHRVIVNHENDVITNWPALDEDNCEDMQNDFYEYMALCEAEDDYNYFKEKLGKILEW